MDIETFEVEIGADGISAEEKAAAAAICDKLGLSAQKELIDGGAVKKCPYRGMTKEEVTVFSAIFCNKVDVDKFDSGFIPVRVLQVLEHARSLGIFEGVNVWKSEDLSREFLLVGGIKQGYNTVPYILARWGDGIEKYSKLKARAGKVIREELRAKAEEVSRRVAIFIESLKKADDDMISSGKFKAPSYYES
jgi:hypothetical protein